MSRASFKKRGREVGSLVESVAKKSCEDVAITEKYSAALIGTKPDENDLIPVSVSYDMGWQKRGGGALNQILDKVLLYGAKQKQGSVSMQQNVTYSPET